MKNGQNAASDQGLYSLLTGISIQNRIKQNRKSTPDTPKTGNGLIQLIRMASPQGKCGLNTEISVKK